MDAPADPDDPGLTARAGARYADCPLPLVSSARARRCLVIAPSGSEPPAYARGLCALTDAGVPFLVGGALALAAYCGIHRNTKDLDVFLAAADLPQALGALGRAGFSTETPYPHWLAKAHDRSTRHFIDMIFSSGNGAAPVDAEWFAHAEDAIAFGVPVRLCPVEESIWSKAFVMERERYDGADVAHLLLACAASLDWDRLLRRFGAHWRVLFAHLVLFGYVFPDEAHRVPQWVIGELGSRLRRERGAPGERATGVCRGTLLSREQYLPDLARGWRDARLAPGGTMSADAVAAWTNAIVRK